MKNEKSTYFYNLDLLRMFSMFMIVLTHILGKGGLRSAVEGRDDWYYAIVWILQIIAYVAVDCYGLLSGYVGVTSKSKISKAASLWLQVFFYTFLISVLFASLGYSLDFEDWLGAVFPVVTSQYWYITAYFGLLVFKPFLDKGLAVISDRDLKRLVLAIFIVFTLLPALFNNKVLEYSLSKGFGMTWLIILYIFGAYLRRLDLKKYKSWALFATYLFASVLTFVAKNLIGPIWFWYSSPSLVLASAVVFIFFAKWNISSQDWLIKLIKFFAPASLGVYLIHLHPLVEEYFLIDGFISFIKLDEWLFLFAILILALLIYLVCSLIELLRIRIFKFMNVSERVKVLDKYL